MLTLNFDPFPVLETPRLWLRSILPEDAHTMMFLRSDDNVMKFVNRPKPRSVDEVLELIEKIRNNAAKNEAIAWAITWKDDPRMIGMIGFHYIYPEHHRAEIGYMLHPDHWNKGVVSEAVTAAIDYGFNTMKLHSIEANVAPEHGASIRVLKKHGFEKEALFKENFLYEGRFLDSEIYSLLNRNDGY